MSDIYKLRAAHIHRVFKLRDAGKCSQKESLDLICSMRDVDLLSASAPRRKPTPVARGTVSVLAKSGATTLDIVGEVCEAMAIGIRQALRQARGPIEVLIDSGGGSAFHGFSIHDELRAFHGPVTTIIQNAFSAGSVIAMAGDRVHMRKNGFFMAHGSYTEDPSGTESEAELMHRIDSRMIEVYKTRLRGTKVSDLMNNERFLTANECLELGIVDKIV